MTFDCPERWGGGSVAARGHEWLDGADELDKDVQGLTPKPSSPQVSMVLAR